MILIRKAMEPVLDANGIKGYHIGGEVLISLVSKCNKPMLVFSDFNIKSNFTNAERAFIVEKLTQSVKESVKLIAEIEEARAEMDTIVFDRRVNTNYSDPRYLFKKDVGLTIDSDGEFRFTASKCTLSELEVAVSTIGVAKSLLITAKAQQDRIAELNAIIAKGKTCSA